MSELEPLFSGNREAARNTLEILRSDGRVEAVGKGRGVRYRLPQAGLFSS
jgi:predicted transcriptional regulator